MANNAIVIDGSVLEGGGQILRNSAALCCLLKQPITVKNIRAGRSKPGLRPQHLSGLQLNEKLCGGKLVGGRVESTEISLNPSIIKGGSYLADTRTAGSICLLIQSALPCILYADGATEVTLKGGTNADMAPPIDYFTMVFKPIADKLGLRCEIDLQIRGFFPKGGGVVVVNTTPIPRINAFEMVDFGKITKVTGLSYIAGVLPEKVARLAAKSAEAKLKEYLDPDVSIKIGIEKETADRAIGTGNGIVVVAETDTGCRIAGSALGKRGVQAEEVGRNAAEMLIKNLEHKGCVDEYLQDQLIIFMALAKGKSRVRCGPITLHTQTAIHIAQTLTSAKFDIKEVGENQNIIECEGIGLENTQIL